MMHKVRQFLLTSTVLSAAMFSSVAHSSSFSGFAYGAFSNPQQGSSDITSIRNNDLGLRSNSSSVFTFGVGAYGRRGSRFVFDGTGSDAHDYDFSVNAGNAFSLGDFTYHNRPTFYSAGVTGVDFDLTVNLNGIGQHTFDLSLNIDNTPNTGGNVPDFVSINEFDNDVLFDYLGQTFVFEVLGFSRDGGITFEDSTFADESSYTTSEIYGRIDTVVPVPAAVWLFGSGLLALGAMVRRKAR